MLSRDYRALARKALKGKCLYMYGLMLIVYLFSMKFYLPTIWQNFFSRSVTSLNRLIPAGFGWVLWALGLLLGALSYTVSIGRFAAAKILLKGQTPALKQYFPMRFFFKALVMYLVMGILVFLQLLLLLVPGFIAVMAYSLAPYLLLENPDMGPIQALKESRRRMKGHKWAYFCLMCSFIGWMLVPYALSVLVRRFTADLAPVLHIFLPYAVLVLAWPLLTAYMDTAHTAFSYDVLDGKRDQKKK